LALEPLGVRMVVEGLGPYKSNLTQAQQATDKVAGSTTTAAKTATGLGGAFDSAGKRALAFAAGMAAAYIGTQAIGKGLDAVIGGAIRWESALVGVAKTTNLSTSELAALGERMRGLSEELPISAEALLGLAQTAGQLGVSSENLDLFAETAARLGFSTNLGAEEAITGLARLSTILGTSENDVANLGSALVGLGNTFAATESEILDMALRLAGAGRQFGLTEGEILGLGAALRQIGIEAEAGGTAFSRVMSEISKRAALGGQDLEDLAAVTGMTADEFRNLVASSPAEALLAFVRGLKTAEESGQNLFVVLEDLGLSDVRLQRALLGTASAVNEVERAFETGNREMETGNALIEESGKFAETTAAKMERLKNQVGNFAAQLGTQTLPILRDFLSGLQQLGTTFDALGTSIAGVDKMTVAQLPHLRELIAAQEELANNSFFLTQISNNLTLQKLKEMEATILARQAWLDLATAQGEALLAADALEAQDEALYETSQLLTDAIEETTDAVTDAADELKAITGVVNDVEKAMIAAGLESDQVATILGILQHSGVVPAADSLEILELQLRAAGLEGPAVDQAMRLAAAGLAVLEGQAIATARAANEVTNALSLLGGGTMKGKPPPRATGGGGGGGGGGSSPADDAARAAEAAATQLERALSAAERLIVVDTRIADKEREIARTREDSGRVLDGIKRRLDDAVAATSEIERLEKAIAGVRKQVADSIQSEELSGAQLELKLLNEQINQEQFHIRTQFRERIAAAASEEEKALLLEQQAESLAEIDERHRNEIGFLQEQVELRSDQLDILNRQATTQITALEAELIKAQEVHGARVAAIQAEFDAATIARDAIFAKLDDELENLRDQVEAEEDAAEAADARREIEEAIAAVLATQGATLNVNLETARRYVEALRTAAAIQSTPAGFDTGLPYNPPQFAEGGFVPGAAGQAIAAVVHAGELILNRTQQQGLGAMISGLSRAAGRLVAPAMPAAAMPLVGGSRMIPVPINTREGANVTVNATYQRSQSPSSVSADVRFVLLGVR